MPIGPPAMMETPPTVAAFSSRMTLAPLCCAARAAETPVPPAPTTTTSASRFTVSAEAEEVLSAAAMESGSPPASVIALETASLMASEVTVAPVTPSTFTLFAATIAAGTSVRAAPATSLVSCWSVTTTFVIFPPSIVVSTVMSAFLP